MKDRDFERDDEQRGYGESRRRGGNPMDARGDWRDERGWNEGGGRFNQRGWDEPMSSQARFSGYEGMGGMRSREGMQMEGPGYRGDFGGYGRFGGYGGQGEYGNDDSSRGWFARGEGGQRRESYRGRGPKGYTRSDERIREDVCEMLRDNDDVDASEIEIRVDNCEVTLVGTVTDRRMKRLAEDCAERIRGVRDVHNQIRVRDEQRSSQTRQSAQPSMSLGDNGPRARS